MSLTLGSCAAGRLVAAAGATLLLLAPPATARVIEYVSQGAPLFRFAVPDEWQYRIGPDVPVDSADGSPGPAPRVISVRPPGTDGIMWTGLWAPVGVGDFAEAKSYLEALGPLVIDDPEVGYRDSRSVNGMPARVVSGTGGRLGRGIEFVFAVVQIAPDQVAVAAFLGETGIFDRHEEALVNILNSLRPVE